jgi:Ca-activated chloride channel family protein
MLIATPTFATEDPDALYREGRFKEAEDAYAQKDMDHPKDVRFRYNKGCAAFQNNDPKGAAAAFYSVLKRTEDHDIRFRTAYNLGNTAFAQGDFQKAVEYFKQAILLQPENEDARYNLELALRERQKQKEQQEQQKEGDHQDDSNQKGDQESEGRNQEQQQEKPSSDKGNQGDQKDKASQDEDRTQEAKSNQGDDSGQSNEQQGQADQPNDLSGDLNASQPMPDQDQGEDQQRSPTAAMDRKKAEALLDNVQEDPSRFLRFQIPEEKRHGVPSGKDW